MTGKLWKVTKIALLALAATVVPFPVLAQVAGPGNGAVLPPPRTDVPPPPPPSSAPPAPSTGPFAPSPQPSPFAPPDAEDPLYKPNDPGSNGWGWYDLPSLPEHIFADVEVDILKPHLKAALSNAVTFPDGSQVNVQPPTTQLGWTAAPRVEVGWFLPQSLGYFAINYRGFVDQAEQTATAPGGVSYGLRTRLDLNQFGVDYGTTPYSFSPRWFTAGRIGIAGADLFFDNQAVSPTQTQSASNTFYGAGPHVRLDLWRDFNILPGLSVFAQPDLIVMVGQIRQNFNEQNLIPGSSPVQGSFLQRKTQTAPIFTIRAGLSYVPPNLDRWKFMAGYEFEEWWFVGQVDGLNSRGQFNTNGVFLRAIFNF
jgi:hypothetical protein